MRTINLSNAQPNQSQSILLDNTLYDIQLRDLGNLTMGMTITANGVKLVDNAKCVNNVPMLRYNWMEQQAGGNFQFRSTTQDYPYYTNFGSSCQLIYANLAEIASVSPDNTFTQIQQSTPFTAVNEALAIGYGVPGRYTLRYRGSVADTVTLTALTYASAWQGTWELSSAARTNICPYSTPTAGEWETYEAGTGTAPTVTYAFAPGPDGTVGGAARVQCSQGTGVVNTAYSLFGSALSASVAEGTVVSSYLWVKSNTGANQNVVLGILGTPSAQQLGTLIEVTPTWQKFAVNDYTTIRGAAQLTLSIGVRGTFTPASATCDILVSYCEMEKATSAGMLIPTAGAAESQTDYVADTTTPKSPLGVTLMQIVTGFNLQTGDALSWSGTGDITSITTPRSGVTDQLGPKFVQPGRWNFTAGNEPIFTNAENVTTTQFQFLVQGATVISVTNPVLYVNGTALTAEQWTSVNAYTFNLAAALPDNGVLTWSGGAVVNFEPAA
jgi:hypothetical protein